MISLLFLSLGALDAPITQVTVFTDQARVVRTAQVPVSGTQKLEFPPLRDTADVASVRVEAQGAEVKRVELERIEPEKLRTEEAKKVLEELDQLELELDRLNQERAALSTQRDALARLAPVVPPADPLKAPAKLNASGWSSAASFSADQLAKVQGKLRDGERAMKKVNERRDELRDRAFKLGNPQTTAGWRVLAHVSGNGPATLTLTYLVRGANWTPTWDLQLLPDSNTVNVSLAGLVAQGSGEDWTNAVLNLSTAIPLRAVKVPKLMTWKIGVADRFIPTPTPVFSPIVPPPQPRPLETRLTEEDFVRTRLAQLGIPSQKGDVSYQRTTTMTFSGDNLEGELLEDEEAPEADKQELERPRRNEAKERKKMAPPPPPAPRAYAPAAPVAKASESVSVTGTRAGLDFDGEDDEPAPVSTFSLAPPPSWRPPRFGADSPVTLADGYDLSFTSLQKETIPSNKGSRRVALWSAQWPVQVERKLFPALTADAYLVAELKNPSTQVLPGGPAQLSVGADPAGTARLKLVSPGEAFTLPLGIDRALKPVRNVQTVETTQGVFTKDEIGTYTVTIELANPYRAPVAVRVADQWPVSDQKEVETKLVETKPVAIQDAKRGGLEWRLTIPAQQKQVFSFTYTVKRPRGWKLQQQEVVR